MNLTFLGTGADSACPLPFCKCEACAGARRVGSRNLRARSSALVNHDLLIDLGPDTVQAAMRFGHALADVRALLVTHAHSDHIDVTHLVTRTAEYGSVVRERLHVVASRASIRRMSEMLRAVGFEFALDSDEGQAALRLQVSPIAPGEALDVGGYTVTAFEANHDASVESLIYAVGREGRSLLYATDTDRLPESTWAAMRTHRFDVVVLDHTYGPGADGGGHLNAGRFAEHLDRFRRDGLLGPDARVYATHLSHEGNGEHEHLSAWAAERGYDVAWDGLCIEV